jgi:hypothetical protein
MRKLSRKPEHTITSGLPNRELMDLGPVRFSVIPSREGVLQQFADRSGSPARLEGIRRLMDATDPEEEWPTTRPISSSLSHQY